MTNRGRRILFGKWLKTRREAVHLTQLDLAKRLSYENPQIISNIERGFSALPAGRVWEFAGALNCSGIELELRRVLSSSKDESCASALESVLKYLPFIEELCQEFLGNHQALEVVNRMRDQLNLQPIAGRNENIDLPL
jgi:transcriptional regulator with XRE-family HTH domain